MNILKQKYSDIIVCNENTVDDIRKHVNFLTIFLKENYKLSESYILDFFVEKLWTYFPSNWLDIVMKFESEDIEDFLNSDKQVRCMKPWPLSLLAFRASAFSLALPRKPVTTLNSVKEFFVENIKLDNSSFTANWDSLDSAYEDKSGQHKNIPEFCRRHVKPKKQHEIYRMGQMTSAVLKSLEIKHAIDIGAGQGHLSRFLSLCFDFNVATVEAEQAHVSNASNFDKQAFKTMKNLEERLDGAKKLKTSSDGDALPYHLEGSMTAESSKIFLNKIFKRSEEIMENECEESFALLGLHTCGDLAPTILKMFAECEKAKAVLSVGCCYMKLTSGEGSEGYPLSSYVKSLENHHLSYEAKEMACHAIEMYIQRLKDNAPSLKIHCYRATLEKCIVHHYPDKKHMGLRGVKHAEILPFYEYAEKALSKVSCSIPKEFYDSPEILSCLNRWKEVLIFYSLRLIIAPVVESLILLDRMLYLYELGVGKTSIATRIDFNSVSSQLNDAGTIFANCDVLVGERCVHLQISDISGEEKLRAMAPIYFKDAKAALVVFDLSSEKTLQTLRSWVTGIRNNASAECIVLIIGNKSDLKNRQVSMMNANRYAETLGAKYFEVSALTGQGLMNVMIYLAKYLTDWKDCYNTYAAKMSIVSNFVEYRPAQENRTIKRRFSFPVRKISLKKNLS